MSHGFKVFFFLKIKISHLDSIDLVPWIVSIYQTSRYSTSFCLVINHAPDRGKWCRCSDHTCEPFSFLFRGREGRKEERGGGGVVVEMDDFYVPFCDSNQDEENDFLNCCRMLAIWCHENKEDQFSRFQINNLSTFFSLWLLFLLGRHLLNISFFCCVHLHYLFGWVDLSQLETFSAYVVIVDW